jgi:hypothetical protein
MIRFVSFVFLFLISIAFSQNVDTLNTKHIYLLNSIAVQRDSVIKRDSSLTVAKRDSLLPIYSSPLTVKSLILSRAELLKMEYKYTGDYLRLFPFNFIKDLGFPGQPNETYLYSLGNGGISFLQDGILYNDRFQNSFNLNLIQNEDIDSIEIVPLPRGFLYGAYNNPVSVNFITRDFIAQKPYSRIRYYQGPDRETMLDGGFNLRITRKLIGTFELTNRIVDSTFTNTEFSIWQGKIKLKYLLSNEVNIIASYNYSDYAAGYSGGVDVDSIIRAAGNVDNVLYDFRAAPMIYPNGKVKTLTHLPRLRFLIQPTNWLKSDASIYYLYSENEKNDFANDNIENKVFGINVRNSADYDIFNFQLNLNYEKDDIFRNYSYHSVISSPLITVPSFTLKHDLFSFAIVVSANDSDGKLVPSFFYKYSQINSDVDYLNIGAGNNNCSGIGADVTFKSFDNLSFYFGCSLFNKYSESNNSLLLELGTNYNSEYLNAEVKYFVNEYQSGFFTGWNVDHRYFKFGNVDGLGVNLKLNYWKLLVESSSSYYHSLNDNLIAVPDIQTQTGLYYKDILFDKNLDLKTGFVFYYTGKNNVFTYAHGVLTVPSSKKLDFTLAGEIQKSAIVYFVWQNLLNTNYYITPYYPMPSRSIRFGVAWELFN